jgi:hypothetical protein
VTLPVKDRKNGGIQMVCYQCQALLGKEDHAKKIQSDGDETSLILTGDQ